MTDNLSSANRTLVPIRCKVTKDLSEFDGAWTVSGFIVSVFLPLMFWDINADRCGKVCLLSDCKYSKHY